MEPMPSAMEMQSFTQWTTREFPNQVTFLLVIHQQGRQGETERKSDLLVGLLTLIFTGRKWRGRDLWAD